MRIYKADMQVEIEDGYSCPYCGAHCYMVNITLPSKDDGINFDEAPALITFDCGCADAQKKGAAVSFEVLHQMREDLPKKLEGVLEFLQKQK